MKIKHAICEGCGIKFEYKGAQRYFHSKECAAEFHNAQRRGTKQPKAIQTRVGVRYNIRGKYGLSGE